MMNKTQILAMASALGHSVSENVLRKMMKTNSKRAKAVRAFKKIGAVSKGRELVLDLRAKPSTPDMINKLATNMRRATGKKVSIKVDF